MAGKFRVACVQNCAEREMAPSIEAAAKFIRAAAKDGAELIQLPEMVTLFEPDNDLALKKTLPEASDPGVAAPSCSRKPTPTRSSTAAW
jgi:predicted amidohydrolase